MAYLLAHALDTQVPKLLHDVGRASWAEHATARRRLLGVLLASNAVGIGK